jgi:hypothetical protein
MEDRQGLRPAIAQQNPKERPGTLEVSGLFAGLRPPQKAACSGPLCSLGNHALPAITGRLILAIAGRQTGLELLRRPRALACVARDKPCFIGLLGQGILFR